MRARASLFLLAACIFTSCCQESFKSKVISETVNKDGVTMITSEVYPGDGDTITVWIGLPAGDWDGRFVGTGGSGFYGGKESSAEKWAKKGMVGVACNCGHDVKDWSFLYDNGSLNEVQLRDFGHYALHVMTVYAKQYVTDFYGRKPSYCYFVGSSTGGRHALQVAQKYPEDYDAVFAGCPAWHNDLYVPARAWAQVVMKDEGHLMPMTKFEYARKAIIAFEDPKDGLADGIVNNPFDYSFDINSLAGTVDPATGEEFTADDARVIERIWDGCPYEEGKLWYYFTATTDFHKVASSNEDGTGKLEGTTLGLLRYGTELNPDFCLDSLSVQRYIDDVLKAGSTLEGEMSATADLTPLHKSGGKLLIMHGLDDDMVPPGGTIRYFEEVCKACGGYDAVSEYVKLYLVPGINHSFKGPGANIRGGKWGSELEDLGEVGYLIDWVENGVEPGTILFSKEGFGCRPFYPYPQATEYLGGPIDNPESFGPTEALKESYLKESASVTWK